MVELQLFSCESNTLPLDHCDHCAHLESYHAEIVTEKPDIYTAVVNSVYLSHSLMIVAAADAYVVQEHQTSEKASRELPTELQVINIHVYVTSSTTVVCYLSVTTQLTILTFVNCAIFNFTLISTCNKLSTFTLNLTTLTHYNTQPKLQINHL